MPGDITTYLSKARMATYVKACGGDESRALDLYKDNARISAQAFESLHYFEIFFRNAIDAQLKPWNAAIRGTSEWTIDAAPLLLSVIGLNHMNVARDDARKAVGTRRTILHDDVVAQFSLGTWRYVLPSSHHQGKQKLWDDCLELAFPNRHGIRPDQIAQSVSIVYDFRNRVAHHEPVFALDLRGKRSAMRTVLQCIGGDVRKWFIERDPLPEALGKFYSDWPQFERKN